MQRLSRLLQATCLLLLISGLFVPVRTSPVTASTTAQLASSSTRSDFPTVDPNYIYNQLFFMVMHFQHREAGYDNNLPVTANGHDAFAAYWAQEALHDLQGFGPQMHRDSFTVSGWKDRPTTTQAMNVEVSVPGATHPEQVVVIGCHYDGEAISTQSANDDASGCAIELGVAKAMGEYWRSHHVYPARTLRFVIFDAEEQGLYGSFHYLNSTINGDVPNIVAMFNEEQNGIAYPLRYLGQLANPLLPFYIEMSPLQSSQLYPSQSKLSQTQKDAITRFHSLMQQAIPAAFEQFRAIGFQGLTYHSNGKDIAQPLFTSDQLSNIHMEDDILGGSDQIPFTLAGLPCATFVGNSSYYGARSQPAYPYDQREDTIQLMNTYADGSSLQSYALTLALALPGMLTTWMLHQPDVLGESKVDTLPLAAMSDIGLTQVGQSIPFDATASLNPVPNTPLTYSWNFGDGTTTSGLTVSHTYTATGHYTVTLTLSSAAGVRKVSKTLTVVTQPTLYNNPYAGYIADGNPPANPSIIYPGPDTTLSDKVVNATGTMSAPPGANTPAQATTGVPLLPIVGGGLLMVALISGTLFVFRRRQAQNKRQI